MRRRIRLLALAALLLAARAGLAAEAEPPVLTLDAALSRALSHNRQVAASELDVARAKDRLGAARTRRWPTLQTDVFVSRLLTPIDFTFEKGVFGDYPGLGPIPSVDTTISTPRSVTTLATASLKQPISQLYRIGLGVKANALGVEAASEGLRAERVEIAGAVRAAYYGALRAEASLVVARESAGLAREIERLSSEAVRKETALEADLLDARAKVSRADADVATLEDALRTQKELLNAYLAEDLGRDFRLAPVPEIPAGPVDVEASRRDARDRRPSVRQARLAAGSAELDTKIARAAYLPDVSLMVSYLTPRGTELLPRNVASAGVSFSWEVFDGGRKAKELAEKRKAAEQASLRARETEELAAVEVARDARRLDEKSRLLSSARLAREAAGERLRVTKNRYDQGATLLSELLRAQTTLADASREESEALLSYWTARAEYEKSHGEDR